MKNKIMKRKHSYSLINKLVLGFILRYVNGKSKKYVSDRGHRMAVYANDWIGLSIYLDGVYERDCIDDLLAFVEHIGIDGETTTALDIGANIGNHSILFAKYFSKVYSFEPNINTFKLLEFNSSYRKNISPLNVGIGDFDGKLLMYEDDENYGASSVIYADEAKSAVEIKVIKLDSISNNFENIKLIKIDVEGMELNVLKGAIETIKINYPIIAFEQNLAEFNDGEESPSINFLRNLGYEICLVQVDRLEWSKFRKLLIGIKEIFLGRCDTRNYFKITKVQPGNYPMLIALPRHYIDKIS
jgi:FkbM family methyltransferase